MATYITVTSQKGGVGKTTTSLSIGHGLARQGKEVLLVDLDPQGQTAIGLGFDPAPGIFDFIVKEIPLMDCICATEREDLTTRDGFSLLPGDSKTKSAVSHIRDMELDAPAILRSMGDGFDYVVFDTPASGVLQEAAIRVADVLVIPGRVEAFGLDGIAATLAICRRLHTPEMTMILPVAYDKRVKEHGANLEQLQTKHAGFVAAPIPQRSFVAEAQSYGLTVWEYKGYGREDVQMAYAVLVEWISPGGEIVYGGK